MTPQTAEWQERLDYASLSDVGLRRSNNQDSLAVMVAASQAMWHQRGDLFMVADGMGAHAAGELASKLSTDTVPLVYQKLVDRPPSDAALAAVEEANAAIHNRGQASPDFKGMGTTTTTLILLPQGALLAHVGDSRAYRLRANRFEQLTFDHSLVWEMRASGQIQGPVPDYVPKNVITRSLGPNQSVQVDLEGPLPIVAGDTFLLCSDGLSGPVKDEEMGTILNCMPPTEAVRALIDLANLRGGPDNITAIVAKAIGTHWSDGAIDTSAAPSQSRPIHPLLWVVAGVLGLAGLGMLGFGYMWLGAVCLLIATLVGGGSLIYSQGGDKKGFQVDGRRLGRGPYTAFNCEPSADFARQLAEIVSDLRGATSQVDLGVDWVRFNALLASATAAMEASDFAKAIRQYCQAMSYMMGELKRQGKIKTGASRK